MVRTVFYPTRLVRGACRAALTLCLLATAHGLAQAQTTVTFDVPGSEINADTTIRGGGYASVNYSSDDVLESKRSDEAYTRRILMKFDTQNLIPANAVINSAKLQLVLKNAGDGSSRPISVYRVTKSFQQRETNWLEAQDAAWWSSRGGDLGEKFGTTYVTGATGSTYTFDVTSLVQRTVKGEFGSRYTRLALVDTGASSSSSYRAFHSTRATNAALRPKLVVSYGGTTAAPTESGSTGGGTGTTLKVMQWNVHKMQGTDGRIDTNRIADWVVRLGAHVISMNEVPYYSGEFWTVDLPAKLDAMLQQKTGQTWYYKYVSKYGPGAERGPGNLILSRFPFSSSGGLGLSYNRSVVQASIVVNGRTVNLFSTHVDYYNASYRTVQTNQVKSWSNNFSSPRIVMGDFNTRPGTSDYYIMANAYADAWAVAKADGTASTFKTSDGTRGGSRFDYVYYSKNSPLVLKSVTVPNTASSGAYPSDHDPVVAVFQVQ